MEFYAGKAKQERKIVRRIIKIDRQTTWQDEG